MKAFLKFDLNEEREEFKDAMNGRKYYSALFEFDQYLRSLVKYNEKEQWPDAETIRTRLHEILSEQGVSLWD